ncbi:MAG: DNA methyltransferase [Flavihumibacter sp.]|nr:DNA methyltransferase [Flavihumibacter sp.]
MSMDAYQIFLDSKIPVSKDYGINPDGYVLPALLKPHQADAIRWALKGGRRALFEQFGLGKTIQQLLLADVIIQHTGKSFLIGLPLGVKPFFNKDYQLLLANNSMRYPLLYVLDMDAVHNYEQSHGPCIFMCNYERIREGKLDAAHFGGVSFDEASVLRSLDTVTTNYIIDNFSQVPYRFVCTATPTPNEYTEILNYAHFLGVMDRGQALTRWFQRNSTKAGHLTLYPHKEAEFWLWVSSWALFITTPSDLGYSDEGYKLPGIEIVVHEVEVHNRPAIIDRKTKQFKALGNPAQNLQDGHREKKLSIDARVNKMWQIINEDNTGNGHWLLWHHLEDERKAIEASDVFGNIKTVYGSQPMDVREDCITGFAEGRYKFLATKPEIAGSGSNFQHYCHQAIYLGIDDRFNDFIQSVYRIQRFQQLRPVKIHIIITTYEQLRYKRLMAKWRRHEELLQVMRSIVKQYGLSNPNLSITLKRSMQVTRQQSAGNKFTAVLNDNVLELSNTTLYPDNSIAMHCTSVPFGDQYEYSENYRDMGHNDGDAGFFEHMNFLTPHLLRTLMPGRVAAIHVKDRIHYSYQNGAGFPTVNRFSDRVADHFEKHGFWFLGRITITTDVVQENNQTYRLGWSEQCKDGSRMGVGLPEYVLLFRKAPTDTSNGYADNPVLKGKYADSYYCHNCQGITTELPCNSCGEHDNLMPLDWFSCAYWQLVAHSYWKSSGDVLLPVQQLRNLGLGQILQHWRSYDGGGQQPYLFEKHLQLCQSLEVIDRLPGTFMIAPPNSNHPDVWTDVNRMNTLNTQQANKKKEKHVCPFQLDVPRRLINRFTMPGELVADVFGGLGTVGVVAIEEGRRCVTVELNEQYYTDSLLYQRLAERKATVPSLFDMLGAAAVVNSGSGVASHTATAE